MSHRRNAGSSSPLTSPLRLCDPLAKGGSSPCGTILSASIKMILEVTNAVALAAGDSNELRALLTDHVSTARRSIPWLEGNLDTPGHY
jgi:hypothetical protein